MMMWSLVELPPLLELVAAIQWGLLVTQQPMLPQPLLLRLPFLQFVTGPEPELQLEEEK